MGCAAWVLGSGCGSTVTIDGGGSDGGAAGMGVASSARASATSGAGAGTGSAGGATIGSGAGPPACTQVPCSMTGTLAHCGDCVDNDQDGLVDAADASCTGPCDNGEQECPASDCAGGDCACGLSGQAACGSGCYCITGCCFCGKI